MIRFRGMDSFTNSVINNGFSIKTLKLLTSIYNKLTVRQSSRGNTDFLHQTKVHVGQGCSLALYCLNCLPTMSLILLDLVSKP